MKMMNRIKDLLFVVCAMFIFVSCSTYEFSVSLDNVDCPFDAKKQIGYTKIISFVDNEICKYRYEDDYIDIVWYVDLKNFNFNMKNKTGKTIKINWDDVSFVDVNRQTRRVMHSGVKYIERNNSQPATSVPKNAYLKDCLIPTDNVRYDSGWKEYAIMPKIYKQYKDTKEFEENKKYALSFVGKTMSIYMPIMIDDVQNDYIFTFIVDKVINTSNE